jgi:hypothetical protein
MDKATREAALHRKQSAQWHQHHLFLLGTNKERKKPKERDEV